MICEFERLEPSGDARCIRCKQVILYVEVIRLKNIGAVVVCNIEKVEGVE